MAWTPVRLSPVEYVNEPGILMQLNQIIVDKGYQRPIILTDNTVIKATSAYLPKGFYDHHDVIIFNGNCTYPEAERIQSLIKNSDVLIALGGGQLLDTAKNVADKLRIDLINVPTIPSNCASITTKSMVYSEGSHEMIGRQRHPVAVQLVLVDPTLLRHSPTNYLLSGIGDTLAKWYEIRRRLNVAEAQGAILDIARKTIEISRDRTLAIRNLDQIDDKTFSNLLDTIFLVAASVDGFAAARGRSVAAHSFHNGYLKVTDHPQKTHGEIVALGILAQLAIEGETDELIKLIAFYRRIGLPYQLSDLGLAPNTSDIQTIAADMVKPDNARIQTVFHNLTQQTVTNAINSLGGDVAHAISTV